MSVGISIDSLVRATVRATAKAMAEKQKRLERAIAIGVNRGAELVRGKTIEKINKGGRNGRTYKRRTVRHVASVPGEPPATDLGQLVRSIRVVAGKPGSTVTAFVEARAPYAYSLEHGTRSIAPRPFMQPGKDTMDKVNDIIRGEVARAVGG